jgi:DNA-directed RNA polymerase subunit RPC12/RpoP
MPMYDFECPACGHRFEDIAKLDENVTCPSCTESWLCSDHHLMPATKTFTTIVATSRTSKRYKAGYSHKYVNRPAEKIQVGASGKTPR